MEMATYGNSSYLGGIDLDKMNGDHTFMAEDMLVPKVDSTDGARLHMFTQHIVHSVVLNNPEIPKWFTGFEKQVGEFSPSSLKRAKVDLKLIRVMKKNALNTIYIFIQPSTKKIYLYDVPYCKNITEDYGYRIIDKVKGKKEGEIIKKDEIISQASTMLADGNCGYGKNLKAIFTAFKGLTYEDAIVITKSTAEKMAYTSVDDIEVSMNTNDVLINIYGKKDQYKTFPEIGEYVKKKILCARRRIDSNTILFDFSSERMNKVSYFNDSVFYTEGRVVDIDVYTNTPVENIAKYDYNAQIMKYLNNQVVFYTELRNFLQMHIDKGHELSENAAFWYRKADDYLNPNIKFCTENNKTVFDNFLIKFKVENIKPLVVGDKLTGRLTFVSGRH